MYFIILIRFLQIEKFTAVNIHEMRCKAKMTLFSSKFAASLNFAQALLGLIAIPDNIDEIFFSFFFSLVWFFQGITSLNFPPFLWLDTLKCLTVGQGQIIALS